MAMTFVKEAPVVTQAVLDKIEANMGSLGVAEVTYGRTIHPNYPAVEVESFPKDRDIATTRQFGITLRVSILILHGEVQSAEKNKKETEELAEMVEDLIHQDIQLPELDGDPRVIAGWVQRMEPGVTAREKVMIKATRLTWVARSREEF